MPEIQCPNGHVLTVQENHMGRELRCPLCQAQFVAGPGGAAPVASKPAAGKPAWSQPPAPGGPAPGPTPPAGGPAPTPGTPLPDESVAQRRRRTASAGSILAWFDGNRVGKPLLIVGLLMVIMARGCDGLGMRWSARLIAKASAEPRRFDQETARRVRDKSDEDERRIRDDRAERRDDLRDDWEELAEKALNSRENHVMRAFYYHAGFLLGSIVLATGLLLVGLHGQGTERVVSWIMLAIITFSIYIGGVAWIEAIGSSAGSLIPVPQVDPFDNSF